MTKHDQRLPKITENEWATNRAGPGRLAPALATNPLYLFFTFSLPVLHLAMVKVGPPAPRTPAHTPEGEREEHGEAPASRLSQGKRFRQQVTHLSQDGRKGKPNYVFIYCNTFTTLPRLPAREQSPRSLPTDHNAYAPGSHPTAGRVQSKSCHFLALFGTFCHPILEAPKGDKR